jgi:glycosyltransferase involved in cell wall biosynthesis
VFIPVGPNLPFPDESGPLGLHEPPTIGVFSITGGQQGALETSAILLAVQHAAQRIGKLRLSVFGRHAELREDALRDGLREAPVQLSVEGVLEPAEVVKRLAACDVFLFVRKGISTRRGSAIAGIAAGLPIVAYSDLETAPPVTNAGIVLIDPERPEQLGSALVQILSDSAFRQELAARSRDAYRSHFAWKAIAKQYAAFLHAEMSR